MNSVQEENGGCCGLSAVDDARRVAAADWNPLLCYEFQGRISKNMSLIIL